MQEKVLLSIVRKNKSSRFGKLHDFKLIGSIQKFQEHVPLHTEQSFRPHERHRAGKWGRAPVTLRELMNSAFLNKGQLAQDQFFFEFMPLGNYGKMPNTLLAKQVKRNSSYRTFITHESGIFRHLLPGSLTITSKGKNISVDYNRD